jgi:hypothetical protein
MKEIKYDKRIILLPEGRIILGKIITLRQKE